MAAYCYHHGNRKYQKSVMWLIQLASVAINGWRWPASQLAILFNRKWRILQCNAAAELAFMWRKWRNNIVANVAKS